VNVISIFEIWTLSFDIFDYTPFPSLFPPLTKNKTNRENKFYVS